MRGLSFRTTVQKKAVINAAEKSRPPPERKQREKIPGAYLSSHSPLRCFWYAKGVRGRWSDAERVCTGMRWNWYLSHGKRTPHFTREAPEMPGVTSGRIERVRERMAHPFSAGERQHRTGLMAQEIAADSRVKKSARLNALPGNATRVPARMEPAPPNNTEPRTARPDLTGVAAEERAITPAANWDGMAIRVPALFFSRFSPTSAQTRAYEEKTVQAEQTASSVQAAAGSDEEAQTTNAPDAGIRPAMQEVCAPYIRPARQKSAKREIRKAAPLISPAAPCDLQPIGAVNAPRIQAAAPAQTEEPRAPAAGPAQTKPGRRHHSSERRRTFMLKQAVGAAALPE